MRILVIGTNRFSHYELMKAGHSLTMVTRLSGAFTSDISKGYSALHFLPDEAKDQDIVQLAGILNKIKPFEAVVSFHDGYQAVAIKISKNLALPNLYTQIQISNCHDKLLMRNALKSANLTTVESAKCSSILELQQTLTNFSFPCVVKPISGTGSVSVFQLLSLKDALVWLEKSKNMRDQIWLVETFVFGKEFSIETLSERGKHRVIAITEKFKRGTDFIEIGHLVPARLSKDDFQQLTHYVIDVLNALQIENGPTHTEIMLTKNGPEIIETHTRTGGDRIPQLVKLACGIDMHHLAALQATGESVIDSIPDTIEFKQFAAIAFKCDESDPPKTITQITGCEKIESHPRVVDLHLYKKPGELVGKLTHSFDRSAHVITIGPQALETWQLAQTMLLDINIELNSKICNPNK